MAACMRSVFFLAQLVNNENKKLVIIKIVIHPNFLAVSKSDYINCDSSTADMCFSQSDKDIESDRRICRCTKKFLSGTDTAHWRRRPQIHVSPTLFFCILRELETSSSFRSSVCDTVFCQCNGLVGESSGEVRHRLLRVSIPWHADKLCILDKAWVYRIERLIGERIELDDMMAWLSTLGGAFSSLGDTFGDCAINAGKISVRQWKIAARLGDPITLAKCKLYMAISLMQLGEIRRPKALIRQQYQFAVEISRTTQEFRLVKMCKGAWAKLQFLHQERKNYKRRDYSLALTGSLLS